VSWGVVSLGGMLLIVKSRMMMEAAHRMNVSLTVLDSYDSPASLLSSKEQVIGSFKKSDDIIKLAKKVDVITVEIEHVDTATLDNLTVQVHPSPKAIKIIQDKYLQKEFLSLNKLEIGEYKQVLTRQDVEDGIEEWGLPVMLKSKVMAYDGRGNYLIKTKEEIDAAIKVLGDKLYMEKFLDFKKELAVMVARDLEGNLAVYETVETIQRNNICHLVIAPAQIDGDLRKKAQEIAKRAIKSLDGAGIFGVELFLLKDDSIVINEIAPRPHNSGHYTIEACYTSQFEQHLRAILGLPLGDPSLKVNAAIMINILGDGNDETTLQPCLKSLEIPGATMHLYGKKICKVGRKMGHITLVGESMSELFERLATLSNPLDIPLFPLVSVIMGSDSDLEKVKPGLEILEKFRVPFEVDIVSAHRTPERMLEWAKNAHNRGIKVVIAAAGGAAHLPGMVAAVTPLPVIGLPISLSVLDGLDSLYSIVQMPRGVPVATVAINNSVNAALLSCRILGSSISSISRLLLEYKTTQESIVMDKVSVLKKTGYSNYHYQ
jgi:phosphoribosylaminoimidazole carboxylase